MSGDASFGGTVRAPTSRTESGPRKRCSSSEAYLAEAQRLSHTGSWAYKAERRCCLLV